MPMKKKLANMVDGCFLPKEIVEKILLRLPAKTLVEFQIVSKEWKSLISSSYFKRLHYEKSLKNLNLILLSQQHKELVLTTVGLAGDVLDQWDLGLEHPVTMLPSPSGLNNLLCFIIKSKRFVVCNPSTKQTIYLPEPNGDYSTVVAAGFGYLPSNQCVIISRTGRKNWQMITFSSAKNGFRVGGWEPIEDSAFYQVGGLCLGVSAKGVLYWARFKYPHTQFVCFDLCEEKFFTLSMPDEIKNREFDGLYSLLELNGDLHLTYWKVGQQNMELWKLDDVRNKRWTKQYICVNGLQDRWTKQYICVNGLQASFYFQFRPVMLDVDGEMLVCNGGFLEWYSLQDGVFRIREKGEKRIPGSQNMLNLRLHMDLPFL